MDRDTRGAGVLSCRDGRLPSRSPFGAPGASRRARAARPGGHVGLAVRGPRAGSRGGLRGERLRLVPVCRGAGDRPAGGGLAALSRGGCRGHDGQRVRRRPAQLRRAEVLGGGSARGRVGQLRRRPRAVRADRRPRHRRSRERVRGRLEPQPDPEVRPLRQLPHLLGASRQRARGLQLRLLAEPHAAAGRWHRRRRQLRVRGGQRQRPHRALQPGRR